METKSRKAVKLLCGLLMGVAVFFSFSISAQAKSSSRTGVTKAIEAVGVYSNWDGVTNVAQFKGSDGEFYFAVDSGSTVVVYKTKGGKATSGSVTLKKQHPIFGTITCDKSGYFYLVTGEENTGDDTSKETVFISSIPKYFLTFEIIY